MRRAFTTKPARSGEVMTFLFNESVAYCAVRVVVSGLVSNDEINSTSRSTGTGLKKCMPMTCSGRWVAMANLIMGIEDVFVARMAAGSTTAASIFRKTSSFDLFIFRDRFDHQFAVGQVRKVGGVREVVTDERGLLFAHLVRTALRARVTYRCGLGRA